MQPLFAEPGETELVVECDGQVAHTSRITVLPLPGAAAASMQLLFPEIPSIGLSAKAPSIAMQLLFVGEAVSDRAVSANELGKMRDIAETMKRHPDWAEIFPMLLALNEARVHNQERMDALRASRAGGTSTSQPAWPDSVQLAMTEEVTNVYAKALQAFIRHEVLDRKIQSAKQPRR
jgi:hypothetical protein